MNHRRGFGTYDAVEIQLHAADTTAPITVRSLYAASSRSAQTFEEYAEHPQHFRTRCFRNSCLFDMVRSLAREQTNQNLRPGEFPPKPFAHFASSPQLADLYTGRLFYAARPFELHSTA